MHTVLLVEDDQELACFVRGYLSQHGYRVQIESCGSLAIGRILRELPDAVILDVNLPGRNGFEVCKEVRSRYPGVILMLTARLEDVDEVKKGPCVPRSIIPSRNWMRSSQKFSSMSVMRTRPPIWSGFGSECSKRSSRPCEAVVSRQARWRFNGCFQTIHLRVMSLQIGSLFIAL